MGDDRGIPRLRQIVLDAEDARALAEFYRQLLDLAYRPGDEPPPAGQPDPQARDWLVLRDSADRPQVAIQPVPSLPASTWPTDSVPQQLHLDLTVPDVEELRAAHERVLALGGRMLLDRFNDPEEPLRVYADPAGHPFCVFVG